MVFALPENEGSARRRAQPSRPLLSCALGKSLRAMAGEHSGLVHQPPGVVGTPDTGVVPEIKIGRGKRVACETRECSRYGCLYRREGHSCADRVAGRRLDARSRHARYLVFIVAVGV